VFPYRETSPQQQLCRIQQVLSEVTAACRVHLVPTNCVLSLWSQKCLNAIYNPRPFAACDIVIIRTSFPCSIFISIDTFIGGTIMAPTNT